MTRARVRILPERSVLDPQGAAVLRSLQSLGHSTVVAAHVGRIVELELDATSEEAAHAEVAQMCESLLANPLIERYEIELLTEAGVGA
jgi:phosphoribosylformylglycinamidine synthase